MGSMSGGSGRARLPGRVRYVVEPSFVYWLPSWLASASRGELCGACLDELKDAEVLAEIGGGATGLAEGLSCRFRTCWLCGRIERRRETGCACMWREFVKFLELMRQALLHSMRPSTQRQARTPSIAQLLKDQGSWDVFW